MISDYPNHMVLDSDDAPWNDREEMDFDERWSYEFPDGSKLILINFEDPKIIRPHKRFKTQWQAEIAADYISEETLDNDEAKDYILKNFPK